jgi:hypothetical protein
VKTEKLVAPAKAGAQFTRVEIRVANRGYLSTYGISSAKKLPFSEPLRATVEATGASLAAPPEKVIELGHLAGWGQGLSQRRDIFLPWTRGNVHERFFTLVCRRQGQAQGARGKRARGIPHARSARITTTTGGAHEDLPGRDRSRLQEVPGVLGLPREGRDRGLQARAEGGPQRKSPAEAGLSATSNVYR